MVEASWTAPGNAQPPYVNMKRDGKIVRITVRQASINGGLTPGPTALVEIPIDQFDGLMYDAMSLGDG